MISHFFTLGQGIEKELEVSALMGRVLFFLTIAIVIVFVVKKLRSKKS
jgi:hypothetical protein